ncbi:hypothetical protein [Chitinophaga varians]|uniref:hypothetical protein n=1 Tax=Chitinophaga varians TaxID=2202339 RepID=UPI00165F9575|nr:hypothetical protein [Chitinophaga varians]MBC9909918.1 hypothetical protein [Chitinophaga varians]
MGTKKAKNIVWGLCLAAIATFTFTGCSKKDDPPAAKKITIKYTITANGVSDMDDLGFSAQAGNHDASQYGAPVWKINGAEQGNQDNVSVDDRKFLGSTKTYVLETVKPFDFAFLKVTCTNMDGEPIILTYKAEINGQVQTNENATIVAGGGAYIKDFSYKAQ